MIKGILLGALGVVLLGLIAGYVIVSKGWLPANADSKPPAIEKWIAGKSLQAALEREASPDPNPLPKNDSNLLAGIKIYAANCLICHGASDGMPSNIAKGLYQRAPQLAKHGVEDDPEGETYWVVEHGIRMTGMPSFGAGLTKDQIWQVTMFLKNMDALPSRADKAWKALASAASSPVSSASPHEEDDHDHDHPHHSRAGQ